MQIGTSLHTLFMIGWMLLAFGACTKDALLHDEYGINIVPEEVVGAKPYYASRRQPAPRILPMPDSIAPVTYSNARYATTILPYEGVAVWLDGAALAYVAVPGMLDFKRFGDDYLEVARATDAFRINYATTGVSVDRISAIDSRHPDPYRFLSRTLQHSGYDRPYVHLECPDPDSVLAGFTLTTLNNPSCLYD